MSKTTDKGDAKRRARTLAAKVLRGYGELGWGHKSREDLEYGCGLTRDEADRVFRHLQGAEKTPEYTHHSDWSGGSWDVLVSEETIMKVLLGS